MRRHYQRRRNWMPNGVQARCVVRSTASPIVVKDNYETIGMQTADGSLSLAGWIPPDDAYLVKKLRTAGAIVIAKTNMHEFAYGITTVGSLFGSPRNPYALDRNPGGSSGGTGAAVAANFAAIGMGS